MLDTIAPLQATEHMSSDRVSQFLDGLTELSRAHGIGIAGSPVMFVMERDDYDRAYRTSKESEVEFA